MDERFVSGASGSQTDIAAVPSHQTVRLARGRHQTPADGACVMELASMLAGEPFSDRPRTVCPVIAGFLRSYNDGLDDDRRQDLYAHAALAVGTRGSRELTALRRRICADRAARGGSRLRSLLAGSAGVGQAAARSFLETDGEHRDALAFVERLIEAPEPQPWRDRTFHDAATNLARLDSRAD